MNDHSPTPEVRPAPRPELLALITGLQHDADTEAVYKVITNPRITDALTFGRIALETVAMAVRGEDHIDLSKRLGQIADLHRHSRPAS